MKIINRILKHPVFINFSTLTVSNILSQLLIVIVVFKVTILFSPDKYGIYTFLIIQGQLIMTLGDVGMRNIIIRSVARNPRRIKSLFNTGVSVKLLSIVIFTVFYFIYNLLFGSLSNIQIVLLYSFALFSSINNLIESFFFGMQKMIFPAVANIAFNVIWLILILIWPFEKTTVNQLFFGFVVVTFVKTFLYIFLFKRSNHVFYNPFKVKFHDILLLVKESWPFYVLSLMMLPISHFSNNFLILNSNTTEVGFFNLSNKLLAPITMIISIAFSAIYPNLAALWIKDKFRFRQIVTKGIIIFSLLTSFCVMIFIFVVNDLFLLLFSYDYFSVIAVSQIQIWYIFLMGINSVIGTIWGASDNENYILKASVINFIISTPALWFGSKYGAYGLSISYLSSFAVFEIYLWYFFLKTLRIDRTVIVINWVIIISIFILSLSLKTSPYFLKTFCVIIVGIIIFYYIKIQLTNTKSDKV